LKNYKVNILGAILEDYDKVWKKEILLYSKTVA
jgi:hypothetical protein